VNVMVDMTVPPGVRVTVDGLIAAGRPVKGSSERLPANPLRLVTTTVVLADDPIASDVSLGLV